MVRAGGDSWYFITADYAFGHALERDTGNFVRSAGGRVLVVGLPVIRAGEGIEITQPSERWYLEEDYVPATSTLLAGPSSQGRAEDTGLYVLRIHDCTTVTAVTESGANVGTSDYQAEPVTVSWAGLSEPFTQLRRYWTCWRYDEGFARISVTGTWGWTATPSAVVEATKIIAKDIIQQRNNNSGVAGFGEFGAVRVRMNAIAIDLLTPYQRVEAFGPG
jgi:hypothetical protein